MWKLPACYDPRFAHRFGRRGAPTSLSARQVVELHSERTYHVYMLGFLPGQAYMGEVAPELALDRRETPRTSIPGGSLAIAASISCVFPLETPCGWHVIGRCPIPLWDHARATALLAPGDKVTFVPVSVREYETLATRAAEGILRIEPVSEYRRERWHEAGAAHPVSGTVDDRSRRRPSRLPTPRRLARRRARSGVAACREPARRQSGQYRRAGSPLRRPELCSRSRRRRVSPLPAPKRRSKYATMPTPATAR